MALSDYDRVKQWRKNNKEKVNEQARRRRAKVPEKFEAADARYWDRHKERLRPIAAERARKRRAADPEGQRRRAAKWRAKREANLAVLAGRPRPSACDLCCGCVGGIVFDHCHVGGQFRGWLCDRCNKVLGLIKDDPTLLEEMAIYLRKHANVEINCGHEKQAAFQGLCGARSELSGS